MKANKALLITAAVALVIGVTGCEKKDDTAQQSAQKATNEAGDAIKNATEAVKQTGEKVAQDVKEASQKVASDVATKAEELAAPVSSKAQEIIEATKKLINDGKLQDALGKWKELGREKLTEEQKAIADGLKAQIDKLLGTTSKTATNAANAVGNLIK